jgi:hypothetical protein
VRSIALSRQNALFADADEGAAGGVASLVETCKFNQCGRSLVSEKLPCA